MSAGATDMEPAVTTAYTTEQEPGRERVSVTIITLNEAEQIADAIDSVTWADEVIVVDAGSRDSTVEIARNRGVRVVTREWRGYVDQKNYAASIAAHEWILSLDADERVSPELAAEIQQLLSHAPPADAYRMPRVTYFLGKWIRTTDFYPDYQTRLYHRGRAQWQGRHVHESVQAQRTRGQLACELQHYSFRDLADQLDRINRYSSLSAQQMWEDGRRAGPFHLAIHPAAAFVRNYILRRGVLDGTAGLTISLMNSYAVFLKFAKLWDMQRSRPRSRQ